MGMRRIGDPRPSVHPEREGVCPIPGAPGDDDDDDDERGWAWGRSWGKIRQPAEIIRVQFGKLVFEVLLGIKHCEDVFCFREGHLGGEVGEGMEKGKKGKDGPPLLHWMCRHPNSTCRTL